MRPAEDKPMPDPMPEPTPDQIALGLRMWFRRVVGIILLAALFVVIGRGIYVAWQVHQEQEASQEEVAP
jgi:predicted negative regulator of RcsB-dependent stress response